MQTPSPSHTAHSGGESLSITRLVQIEIGVHEKQFGIIVGHTILAERMTNAIDRHSAQLETECAALQKRVGALEESLRDMLRAYVTENNSDADKGQSLCKAVDILNRPNRPQ